VAISTVCSIMSGFSAFFPNSARPGEGRDPS
jgi:hypothetical protein